MKAMVLVALGALAQECPPSSGMDVRNAHAMFYDAAADRIVVFGGADACRVRGDTWAWNGSEWAFLSEAGPEPRTFPAVAYDRRRGEAILFGGNTVLFGSDESPPEFLDDTWRWRDSAWARISVTPHPSPRAEAAMAYDAERGRVVLFGGYRLEHESTRRLSDTWEWNGESWRELDAAGPAARNGAVLVDSPLHGGLVLFGGSGARDDTWLLDGDRWMELELSRPTGIFNPAAAYDPVSGAVLRFGGWNRERRVDETWLLAGEGWRLFDGAVPPSRNHAAMALDAKRGRIVLFGGHDGPQVLGDIWEWDGRGWTLVVDVAPKARIENGH